MDVNSTRKLIIKEQGLTLLNTMQVLLCNWKVNN